MSVYKGSSFRELNPELFKRRFESRIEKRRGACWEWQGAIFKNGYGRVNSGGLYLKAHRVAHEIFKGPIPRGLLVRHSCDNPKCVNPDHLLLGTQKDNMRDAKERNRFRGLKGVANPAAKLTAAQVLTIYNDPERTKRGFVFRTAKRFEINRNVVTGILTGEKWASVTGCKTGLQKP